jgi:HAMP domain-containing protein
MNLAVSQLFRLTIAKKLVLGFLSYGILTLLVAALALSSLQRLNEINNRIIERDVPLMGVADKLIETLLAQELYGRRSLILRSSETEALFWKRSEEFKKLLLQMRNLPDTSGLPLDRLTTLHEEYNRLFKAGLEKREDLSSRAFQGRDRQIRPKQEELIQLVNRILDDAKKDQNEKSLRTLRLGRSAFWVTAGLSIGGLFLGMTIALIITRNISRSISQLKLSTREISQGKFDHLPEVQTQDELGDLSEAFQKMAQRLKRLEEMSLDANPLTRLPGNIAIQNVLNQRLQEKALLAFSRPLTIGTGMQGAMKSSRRRPRL